MTIDTSRPFILLDDARQCGAGPARLYVDPVEVIAADRLDGVRPALERLRAAQAAGCHAAGFIGYEAGLALEGRLEGLPVRQGGCAPLLWFGLFDRFASLDSDGVAALLPDPAGAWAGAPRPRISYADYAAAFDRVSGLIASGDIYQANLSFRADVAIAGDPLALYAGLRGTSHGGWGGVVFTERHWLLSCSPELFFTLDDGALTARPMKGTARRGVDAASDKAAAAALADDAKERAENLMIVDLLRNDLARVAQAGSVAVPALYTVETYPTIHTLTSTVTARLADGRDAVDVLAAIFPCGSVTGAPKIRAMEIIDGVEADARGAYTGSIGWLDPAGDAAFNVAIRTLALEQGGRVAELGLGSAVVADSTADGEWRECLAKGAFVTAAARAFDLIETMRFDPAQGLIELDRHLARIQASAGQFGFAYNRHDARNELQAATFRLREPRRVRLLLAPSGAMAVEVRPLPANPAVAMVVLAPRPVAGDDFRLCHKTSDRGFYDEARRAGGAFEVVFVDAQGFLTEGSFTNIFVERDGALVTPPLARGLLPGVLRGALIAEGRAVEGDITPADLAGGFFVGNALRGLIPARLA
ncbi:aminodeoxychorismate synthase component I [Sphingomonas sp. KC8]|uniref:aminodeoxychorismate synthase component I n=1 Tax=Sphingomonas sp. KC8 TaxID=1030157 RepID=UPI0004959B4F|nr:aminodeoxychorismate synthase component I [Sphingomonas sp. KC8]ARS28617.1 para-aminobenzoate synthase component I [Sphingomonas sp. KC8]